MSRLPEPPPIYYDIVTSDRDRAPAVHLLHNGHINPSQNWIGLTRRHGDGRNIMICEVTGLTMVIDTAWRRE